jgi:hypothetical protein
MRRAVSAAARSVCLPWRCVCADATPVPLQVAFDATAPCTRVINRGRDSLARGYCRGPLIDLSVHTQ